MSGHRTSRDSSGSRRKNRIVRRFTAATHRHGARSRAKPILQCRLKQMTLFDLGVDGREPLPRHAKLQHTPRLLLTHLTPVPAVIGRLDPGHTTKWYDNHRELERFQTYSTGKYIAAQGQEKTPDGNPTRIRIREAHKTLPRRKRLPASRRQRRSAVCFPQTGKSSR
jgi:hypothetical protein